MSLISPHVQVGQQQENLRFQQALEDALGGTPWGSLGSLAGMGIGALLALPTGGMSVPMGAMLGGAGGGLFGSLFEEDGQGSPISFQSALSTYQGQQDRELLTKLLTQAQATPVP